VDEDVIDTLGKIIIPSEGIAEKLNSQELEHVNISVQLPDKILDNNDQGQQTDLILQAGILGIVKGKGGSISISVKDEKDKERYSWTFDMQNQETSSNSMTDVNLSIGIRSLSQLDQENESLADNNTGIILSFAHEGLLPTQATVRIYVADQKGVTPGSHIYLYHYNDTTGKLETLPYSNDYVVDEDGYVTVQIVHCSDYVVLMGAASSDRITNLKDQITITPTKKTLHVGKTTKIKIVLPSTLQLVSTLEDSTVNSAIGAVTATYSSSNKKVVKVTKDGKIIAVSKGTAVITTKITLYSGKVMIVKTTSTVG